MQIDPEPGLGNVGGKAHQLYKLDQFVNVPPFFVVTFDDYREIDESQAREAILKECKKRDFNLVAVRSSASVEDSPKTSFAGMFETCLAVKPTQVSDAVIRVVNSMFGEKVSNYCESQGLDEEKIEMAVIVQSMIESRVSGVCFTQINSKEQNLIIEACYGLGEAVVSGKVTPDSYTVNRNNLSIVEESVGYQKYMYSLVTNKDKSVSCREVPFHKRNAKKLRKKDVRNIAKTCLDIEGRLSFGAVDIEWGYEKDVLYILQARPYTGLSDQKR